MEIRDELQKPTRHFGTQLTRMERQGMPSVKGDNNRLVEKINDINLKLKAIVQEEVFEKWKNNSRWNYLQGYPVP